MAGDKKSRYSIMLKPEKAPYGPNPQPYAQKTSLKFRTAIINPKPPPTPLKPSFQTKSVCASPKATREGRAESIKPTAADHTPLPGKTDWVAVDALDFGRIGIYSK